MKGRFAPSPSGRMHLGNVYAALLSWLSVKSRGGEWLLRIEDIDPQRSRKEYADMIRDDLQWLGLSWDEEYTQSERFHIYEEHLRRLQEQNLTYACNCTRADIMATQAPHESDGRVVYKGTCRDKGLPADGNAVRIRVPDRAISFKDGHYGPQSINLADHCGDFILQRKDKAWAYQLAVVVDDALMGVTEVVRGRDLLLSVPQQLYLFQLFDYTAPQYIHIPLLINSDNQRLCKRDKSLDLGQLRNTHSAESLIGIIAHSIGLIPEPQPITPQQLIPIFSWAKVPHDDVIIS